METAALAERSHCVWEGVVQVVEKHLVPAVLPSEDERHGVVQYRPRALWVIREEFVPRMGVREIRYEHPSSSESTTTKERDGKHEAPAFAQRPSERIGSNHPNEGPNAPYEHGMCNPTRQPLLPELFVALSACSLVREVQVPFYSEERTRIVEPEKMNERKRRACDDQTKRMNGKRFLTMPPSPFQKPILELFWIPTKLPLHQQVDRACVMPVVLEHELLPRQGEEVTERMRDVLLPRVRRKGGTMHDVMVDVDVLDADV